MTGSGSGRDVWNGKDKKSEITAEALLTAEDVEIQEEKNMFCKKCGSALQDNAKFCGACGTMVEADPIQERPVQEQPVQETAAPVSVQREPEAVKPVQPKAKKISKKTGIIIAAAAAALVVILVIASLFGGAGTTVAKAFTKSLEAYTAVADQMKLPDMAAIAQSGKHNQEMRMWIEDGAEELDGFGVRVEMAYNQSGREAALIAAPFYEGTDLLTAQMKMDGTKIYVGSPELMETSYLMFDTATIGEDLAAMGAPGMEDLSIDLFALIEEMQQSSQLTKEQQKTLEKAAAALAKAIQVEKTGKEDVKVNGKKLSCKVYELVIPQEAMEDYLDALEDVIKEMDLDKSLDALEDTGLMEMADIEVSVNEDNLRDAVDEMKELVDELGDFVAEIAIHKGYIVAVNSEFELGDTEYSLNVQLGGGENYVDNLYFEMKDEDEYGFIFASEGNHAMTKGVFTDETVFTELYKGKENDILSSEISWEPKAKENNFELVLEAEGDKLGLEGNLTCTKDSLSITVPELEVDGITFGLGYALDSYKAPSIKIGTTLVFAEMDEDDLAELGEQIVENAEEWAGQIEENYSGLIEYLAEMLYYMY